jgi:glycosyltransferase involved in cell wall biosynthesis
VSALPEGPLFSVVVPTYNRAGLLPEALASVVAQTYRPIELVIVDDGSTDTTRSLVQEWAAQTANPGFSVRYIEQANLGAAAARNTGLQEATGRYVQFFDSDDRLHPDRLQRLHEAFDEYGADFIQTGFSGFDPDTEEEVQCLYGRPGENQLELAASGNFWANTLRAAMTVELARRTGPWRADMSCFEDREYMERAVSNAKKAIAIKDVLAHARRGGSSRISDKLRSYEGRKCRILCERMLATAVAERADVSDTAKSAFASRMYGLAFRSNAEGWTDLGQDCIEVAELLSPSLDMKGHVRRYVALGGPLVAKIYAWLGSMKRALSPTR